MKKGITILLLSLAVHTGTQAQTSGWETGINLSGGRSQNLATSGSAGNPFGGQNVSSGFSSWSYSAGVYGRKFFKNMYGIELGLQYTSFGLFRKDKAYFGNQVNPGTGFMGEPTTVKVNYRHNYVEMPIRFVFKKDIKKFSIGCFAGIAPAVLTHAYRRIVLIKDNDREVSKDGSDNPPSARFNLFADAGLLLRANVSTHFSLDFKPYFRITALPTYAQSPYFEERFLSAGLTVSSVWKF